MIRLPWQESDQEKRDRQERVDRIADLELYFPVGTQFEYMGHLVVVTACSRGFMGPPYACLQFDYWTTAGELGSGILRYDHAMAMVPLQEGGA